MNVNKVRLTAIRDHLLKDKKRIEDEIKSIDRQLATIAESERLNQIEMNYDVDNRPEKCAGTD